MLFTTLTTPLALWATSSALALSAGVPTTPLRVTTPWAVVTLTRFPSLVSASMSEPLTASEMDASVVFSPMVAAVFSA